MIVSKKYVTIPQAAKICSVDRSTMHRWVTSGKIPAYSTPGGHKRIQKEDLNAFFRENNIPINIDGSETGTTRILVVDDNVSIQKFLTGVLQNPTTRIEIAGDGFDAGIKLVSFKPHMVILDLSMPNMDGFEVCRRIKENSETENIKILVLTGHGTEENEKKALSLGADAFLTKPASKKTIISWVEKLLGKV